MKIMELDLDEVEAARLLRFANVNNCTIAEAAAQLIAQRLNEWADAVVVDDGAPVKH